MNLELLCDLNMKKVSLINKLKVLMIELKELDLPDRVAIEINDDMFFYLYYYYYY